MSRNLFFLVSCSFRRSRQAILSPRCLNTSSAPPPAILPIDVLLEEERIPNYNARNFYPVNPGDVFNERYKTISKLGFGRTSTVWLAQDTQESQCNSQRYVALKIAVSGHNDEFEANYERNMTRCLEANPSHPAYPFVRTMLDTFEISEPIHGGKHICIVFMPLREPLWMFQERFPGGKLPPPLLKPYLRIMLRALDYIHSECHIIHTDLKMDNILVGFESPSVLEEYAEQQSEHPMARKIDRNGRNIYQSHNNFGPLVSSRIPPCITDFGLAQLGPAPDEEPFRFPIQPPVYHAPEVILGTGWSYSADIWNFGALIWNMLEDRDLFLSVRTSENTYNAKAHIAEMIALLGPPPPSLLAREKEARKYKWDHGMSNPQGKLCHFAHDYFGGPFFTDNGNFLYEDLIPKNLGLESTVTVLEDPDDKRLFLDFVRRMLKWIPEERSSAEELLDDPWLKK